MDVEQPLHRDADLRSAATEHGATATRLEALLRELVGALRYLRLRATRLFDMLRERGYAGSVRTLREHVALVRPKPRREVYLATETMAGEEAQIDWAFVDKIAFRGGERALWLFVMVLAHSRALWGEFVLDLSVHSLVRAAYRSQRGDRRRRCRAPLVALARRRLAPRR